MITALPVDSEERKSYPMSSGLLSYFPAALAGVSKISYEGNKKHNGDGPLQHSRWMSMDHSDCVIRHLLDMQELMAALSRGKDVDPQKILTEVSCLAWRALALSQALHELLGGAPLAPAAKISPDTC